MDLIEFNEILKQCGIWNPVYKRKAGEHIHVWNNMAFIHEFGGSILVKGKVNKDDFELASNNYNTFWGRKLGEAIFVWHTEENDIRYQFANKESLTLFILTLQDQIAKKSGLPETYVKRSAEILTNINNSLISSVSKDLTIAEWYRKTGLYSNDFFNYKTAKLDVISRLNAFNQSVNIFEDFQKTTTNYIHDVNINISQTVEKDFTELDITDFETGSILRVTSSLEKYINSYISKDYVMSQLYKTDCSRILVIEDKKTNISFEYNLMTGEFGRLDQAKEAITDEQKDWIIDEINKTIETVEAITVKIYKDENKKEKTKIY